MTARYELTPDARPVADETPIADHAQGVCLECGCYWLAAGARQVHRMGQPWLVCPICDQPHGVLTDLEDDAT